VLTNNSRFISDTIHSCAKYDVSEVQMHEVDLLFECILIRDGQAALPCWFPRSDVQTLVKHMHRVRVFLCIILGAPWYNLRNKYINNK